VRRTLLGLNFARFSRWQRQRHVRSALTLGGPLDRGPGSTLLQITLLGDLIYILIVSAFVLGGVVRMISARRAKSAGSRLHARLTGVFALAALVPTVLGAVFSVLLISIALEGLFSQPVGNVLQTSLTTARAYENEHRQELARDGRAVAAYLNRERQRILFMNDGEVRRALGDARGQIDLLLTEVFVVDGTGNITARGAGVYEFDYERPGEEAFALADAEGLTIIEDTANNEFRALIAMPAFRDRYLYVTRQVDGNVLSLLDDTTETVEQYQELASARGRLLFQFGLLYLGFAIILILGAIWGGLWFAERLSRPVGRLVAASQRVGSGDLDVRVIEDDGDDEISQLGHYFNQMTGRLKGQRDELLQTNRLTERRRRLFDSVLSSVTSGVVGLDEDGRLTFVNPSAKRLLSVGADQADSALSDAIPEFADLFEKMRASGSDEVQDQVKLVRKGQQESLLVRMSPRRNVDGVLEGYVVAFDDVTDLVSAQRLAAWGDVARRIAHEIKNPLTPIQLSAERIKRKFRGQVGDEADKLDQMTDVIVRQTNDLRRIVDEFSKFARMPEPKLATSDLTGLVSDAVALQKAGQPGVKITADLPPEQIFADIDSTMISQALTNLIKNAGEATEIYVQKRGSGYVTTRDSGTGLGLPIVKKIIEEHSGTLILTDADPFDGNDHFGACATIQLPVVQQQPQATKIPA